VSVNELIGLRTYTCLWLALQSSRASDALHADCSRVCVHVR